MAKQHKGKANAKANASGRKSGSNKIRRCSRFIRKSAYRSQRQISDIFSNIRLNQSENFQLGFISLEFYETTPELSEETREIEWSNISEIQVLNTVPFEPCGNSFQDWEN